MQQKEIKNPDYYLVHYLSVPCYMLQHNQYSREGWLEVRKVLSKYIYEGWTPEIARQHAHEKIKSGHEVFSYTRSLTLIEVEKIPWAFDISQIRDGHAADYCQDVRKWAKHILEDTEPIVKALTSPA